MGKAPANSDENTDGLKKGPWSAEEDEKLIDYIKKHGHGRWRTLPKNAGLRRCGKSCRLRWTNYLRPDIKRGRFSPEEEESIIQLHSVLGNKWSAIAARLPGRTDNEIKNYWNTHIKKRLLRMGIDPVTHAPHVDLLELSSFLYNYAHDPNFLAMVGSASPDLNLLDLAAQYFSKPKTQELVLSHQNPQETSPYYLSELQNHIQTLIQSPLHNQNQLNGEQNPSHQNPNFLINSQNCCVPNSWYPETTPSSSAPVIADSAYFGLADKNYYPCGSDNVHELSPSPMASSGGTLNSSSTTMTYGGGGINNEEERDSHRSNCFMFDILNGSYINSIM